MSTVLWKIKPSLNIPSGGVRIGAGAESSTEGLWLGQLAESGTSRLPKVWLATSKEQVLAVVGKRGSGKSFTLGVIAEGMALTTQAPHVALQERRRAVLLFDPLDVYWTTRFPVQPSENTEAQRHYDLAAAQGLTELDFCVQAWVPGKASSKPSDPSWFGVLELPVPALGPDEWEHLLGVSTLHDPMGQALIDAVHRVVRDGYTRRGKKVAPTQEYDLADIADAVQSNELEATYHAETLRALRQRLGFLHGTGLFSSQGTPVSRLLAPGKLTVILLGRLSQGHRSAVVGVVTKLLMENRGQVAFAEKRLALDPTLKNDERPLLASIIKDGAPRTVVVLDEAQNFLAPGLADPSREVFVRLVKEGRNVGLSVVLATQQPSAIDSRILSQVETFLSHQLVTEADIRAVRENLKSIPPEAIEFGRQELDLSGLIKTLRPGQCVVSSADMNINMRRAVVMSVRPRATIHGGIEL